MIDPFLSFISLPTTTEILDWVTGDPHAIRRAADGWTAAATDVKATSTELENGLKEVVDNWSGDAYKAFVDYMGKVLVELGKDEAVMVATAAKLHSIANALAVARDKVVRILVRLAAALIPLAAIAMFPPAGAVSLAAGAAITAASFAAIVVITQAVSGVLQGIPDLLNDIQGREFSVDTLGAIPAALPKKVPLGAWGPQPDEPTGGAPAPVESTGASGGTPGGTGAPSTSAGSAPMAPSAPAPVAPAPVTPAVMPPVVTHPIVAPPVLPPCAPPVTGAGMDSGLPEGYGWAPPHAQLPRGWHQDPTTGQILPPGAVCAGDPPPGLLPGYGWIAPGTELPRGWSVDPATDLLVGPAPPANGMPPGPVHLGAQVHPAQSGPVQPARAETGGWEAAFRPGGSAFAHDGDAVGAGARE